tara:strand:+ start:4496 stop:5425 length:930 start_codon:yes stop_codon:yes gene_type:complete
MRILFNEHPSKGIQKIGYCSYYGEIYYALDKIFDVTTSCISPSRISQLGQGWDAIIMGFGHTDCGDSGPPLIIRDNDIPLFPILNKEYTGLKPKLEWIKKMNPTAAFTVHHDIDEYKKTTGVPFHRIMWSANEELFRNYGGEYESDLFFSGVTRPEQTENLRERILTNMSRLSDYKLSLNIRSHRTNYSGSIFSPEDYAKKLSSSKICFITTGPADLVGTRYFEVMAGNRSLILCNRMDDTVYENMLIDGYNCVMFSNEDEFFEKAIYYLENEDERMVIVNTAYKDFIDNQTWNVRSNEIKSIIEGYLK